MKVASRYSTLHAVPKPEALMSNPERLLYMFDFGSYPNLHAENYRINHPRVNICRSLHAHVISLSACREWGQGGGWRVWGGGGGGWGGGLTRG